MPVHKYVSVSELTLPEQMALALTGNLHARQHIQAAYRDADTKSEVMSLWQEAAALGNEYARYKLDTDAIKDLNIVQTIKLAAQGSKAARSKIWGERDPLAFEFWRDQAHSGNSDGLLLHAYDLYNGTNTPRDIRAAYRFFFKAAKINNTQAIDRLAMYYWNGSDQSDYDRVLPRHFGGYPKLALHLYRKAAELGHSPSQHHLACIYGYRDPWQTLMWSARASHDSFPSAYTRAVDCYLAGIGVPKEFPALFGAELDKLGEVGIMIRKGQDLSEDPRFLTFGHQGEAIFNHYDGTTVTLTPPPTGPEAAAQGLRDVLAWRSGKSAVANSL